MRELEVLGLNEEDAGATFVPIDTLPPGNKVVAIMIASAGKEADTAYAVGFDVEQGRWEMIEQRNYDSDIDADWVAREFIDVVDFWLTERYGEWPPEEI